MNVRIIVAMVFGVVMGTLLLVGGHKLSGLFILGLVVVLMSLTLAADTSARLLVASLAAVICSGAFAYFAVRSEISGEAIDYHFYGRVIVGHPVTREQSPDEFRTATNYKWALSIVCMGMGAGTFAFRRKLDSSDLL